MIYSVGSKCPAFRLSSSGCTLVSRPRIRQLPRANMFPRPSSESRCMAGLMEAGSPSSHATNIGHVHNCQCSVENY